MCHAGHVNRALERALFSVGAFLFGASYARHAKARHRRLDIKFYGKDKSFTSVVVKRFYCVSPPPILEQEQIYAPSVEGSSNKFQ